MQKVVECFDCLKHQIQSLFVHLQHGIFFSEEISDVTESAKTVPIPITSKKSERKIIFIIGINITNI